MHIQDPIIMYMANIVNKNLVKHFYEIPYANRCTIGFIPYKPVRSIIEQIRHSNITIVVCWKRLLNL